MIQLYLFNSVITLQRREQENLLPPFRKTINNFPSFLQNYQIKHSDLQCRGQYFVHFLYTQASPQFKMVADIWPLSRCSGSSDCVLGFLCTGSHARVDMQDIVTCRTNMLHILAVVHTEGD